MGVSKEVSRKLDEDRDKFLKALGFTNKMDQEVVVAVCASVCALASSLGLGRVQVG